MPLADLPYRIEQLAREGRYAYLSRTAKKIRVLRYVNLCDGPSLWDATRETGSYEFYVDLRLFATLDIVQEYLASLEVSSFYRATGTTPWVLDGGLVITEASYLESRSVEITRNEYSKILQSRSSSATSLQSLEEMVCQLQGIDSLESLDKPKRGRRKKTEVESPPTVVAEVDEETGCTAPTVVVEQESSTPRQTQPKKKTRTTLREQFMLVQNTPSRVIDVSTYGDTMQHQRGKILDRVKHGDRIAQCTCLPDLFPIVSDNIPAFERAVTSLGARYAHRIVEFKALHSQRDIKA